MGFLAPLAALAGPAIAGLGSAGAGIGASFAGAAGAGAGGAATASMAAGAASTFLNTGSGILGGISGFQQQMFQKNIAEANEKQALETQNADLASGNSQEEISKLRTGKQLGADVVGAAASGVDVNKGSPLAVQSATELGGAMDALTIRFNAARQAYGAGIEASNDQLQAKVAGQAATGDLIGGFLKAGSSFLSGSSSLADKWLSYKQNIGSGGGGNISFGDPYPGSSAAMGG